MIKSIGLDLVDISRIERDLERYGDRFALRILGDAERQTFALRRDKALYLAGRFAAKEAVIKALGHYLSKRPPYTQIQIINDSSGQPELHLPEKVQKKLGASRCLISLTHERNYAAAVAVFEEDR